MGARRQGNSGSGKRAPLSRRRRAQIKVVVMSLILLGAVMVALPTVIVLAVGLIPTVTWLIVDITPGRYAFRCIAACNIAGVAPSLRQLWLGANDLNAATELVADPYSWMVFLCSAGAGWLVFQTVPAGTRMAISLNTQRRIAVLRDAQKDLKAEWGPSISASKDGKNDEEAEAYGADAEPTPAA